MYPTGNDPQKLREMLERAFILRDGEGWIRLDDDDPVYVALVFAVESFGPHEAAIAVDQNRYHASGDAVLQTANEILEQYWLDHYQEHYDDLVADYGQDQVDDYGMFTETFDGAVWRLSAADAIAAIRGTDAEQFIEIDDEIEDDLEY